jgi:hypothetical protein
MFQQSGSCLFDFRILLVHVYFFYLQYYISQFTSHPFHIKSVKFNQKINLGSFHFCLITLFLEFMLASYAFSPNNTNYYFSVVNKVSNFIQLNPPLLVV